MLPAPAQRALSTLAAAVVTPAVDEALRARWRSGGRNGSIARGAGELPEELCAAADQLAAALTVLTHMDTSVGALGALFSSAAAEPGGEVLFSWCAASVWRRDVLMGRILSLASLQPAFRERVPAVARDRVVEGPLLDALACAPLIGRGDRLSLPENLEARARLEILIWEAGASALEIPALGPWLWGSPSTFEAMIRGPAHGALRGRVLAARCLEVSARGMPPTTDPELVGRTLQVLQPLLLHPEPLVWVHAARALGRLTGPLEQLEGTLLDWVIGDSPLLRQRAMTAFASLPAERLKFLARQLMSILDSPAEEQWALPAVAAATPYLFFERRDLWDRLAARILAGGGGAFAARALARGLATLWRRGARHGEVQRDIETPLRALREMARSARATSLDEARRWIEVIAMTDAIDDAERDPLDLELGLENLMRLAAQYDDEEADARAARFAGSLAPTFQEARRIALGSGRLRQRAAAINALEGCARVFALRLWGPLLATHPAGEPLEEPNLEETWKAIARAPSEILDLVKERRQSAGADHDAELPLEVLAIRLGGYALDACGEDSDARPRARPDGARHLPLAAQGRGPDRRLAGSPRAAQGGPELALLAPRRHDARDGARRGRRRALARSLRRVVGARDRPPGDPPAARDGAADDGGGCPRAVLRAGRGASHGGVAGVGRRAVGVVGGGGPRRAARRRHGARARSRRPVSRARGVRACGGEPTQSRRDVHRPRARR